MPVHEFYGANPNEFLDGGDINLNHPIGAGYAKVNLAFGSLTLDSKSPMGGKILSIFQISLA